MELLLITWKKEKAKRPRVDTIRILREGLRLSVFTIQTYEHARDQVTKIKKKCTTGTRVVIPAELPGSH